MESQSENRPRPRFKQHAAVQPLASSPEALFGELPRTSRGVGALWSHQADQLRVYADNHTSTADVALELPTGSGKTLVGLLISEWRRRTMHQRVVYACPTRQLAYQVYGKALDQGIPTVLLTGPHGLWDASDLQRYTMGNALAISTYSAIFNTHSHLADAQTLLFDDAHAAEGYVADAWALTVTRDTPVYDLLFEIMSVELDPSFLRRMLAADGPATDSAEIRLLPTRTVVSHLTEVETALDSLSGDASYKVNMLRSHLASCLYYVSRREFYIRPYIPPTFQHAPFVDPDQRVYLSATLGEAGELERAFGRTIIARVPVPEAWDKAGSGRRFFVFPELAEQPSVPSPQTSDAIEITKSIFDLADKRLILTPDSDSAENTASALEVPDSERFSVSNLSSGLQPFIETKSGTLLAPNRYDGMDLADDSCRMVLMRGLPTGTNLQDRFLDTKLRASSVLQERIRTRVLQGSGRCTRGPNDWAVVVILGEDLLRFLSRIEILNSLPAELQAEINFGLEQSRTPADDLVLLAESALEMDEIWREDAEPRIASMRQSATKVVPEDLAELAVSAEDEVQAWQHAWEQEWEAAAREAVAVYEHLHANGLRPYRALWAYLASAWWALAAVESDNTVARDSAAEWLRTAHKAATRTTWLKEVEPLPSATVDVEPVDNVAVDGVISLLRSTMKSANKQDQFVNGMLQGLSRTQATGYEQGLVALGGLLGADSSKPKGKGRADAVWVWPGLWMTVEAKSGQREGGMLSMDYVRQANSHLASVAGDRGESIPESSVSIIVSPKTVVDPDAVPIAQECLYLVPPKVILDIAYDACRAWKELRGFGRSLGFDVIHDDVARIMWNHRILPTQIGERLTQYPIRSA